MRLGSSPCLRSGRFFLSVSLVSKRLTSTSSSKSEKSSFPSERGREQLSCRSPFSLSLDAVARPPLTKKNSKELTL